MCNLIKSCNLKNDKAIKPMDISSRISLLHCTADIGISVVFPMNNSSSRISVFHYTGVVFKMFYQAVKV
jgi:hypothetical protein